jgi:hypothetical protein
MENEYFTSSGSQELKKRLPRGAIKALATKYNYSMVWISRVVSGRGNGDSRIVEDAIRLANREDENREAFYRVVKMKDHIEPENQLAP